MELILLDTPVTDGQPVPGVCEGRMVAYWPADGEIAMGMAASGGGGYIPAVITAAWNGQHAVPMPCVNLRLFFDLNVDKSVSDAVGSRTFSLQPTKGCWTWIPKA